MAVQAQYQSNAVFVSRGEQETKNMEFQPVSSPFLDQPQLLFNFDEGNNGDPRNRVRQGTITLLPPMLRRFSQLQNITPHLHQQQHFSPLVSTGLCLAFDDHRRSNTILSASNNTNTNISSSVLSDELAAQINQQNQEIEQFILAQAKQLSKSIAEKRQSDLRALLSAAEESAAPRMREEEAKIERASRRRAELEDRLAKMRDELMMWKTNAIFNQATAASFDAQLRYINLPAGIAAAAEEAERKRASRAAGNELGELANRAEDAESAHVDPNRIKPARACRTCRARPASVVLLPCRHLCVCENCDGVGGSVGPGLCPVCLTVRTGSVQVFLD